MNKKYHLIFDESFTALQISSFFTSNKENVSGTEWYLNRTEKNYLCSFRLNRAEKEKISISPMHDENGRACFKNVNNCLNRNIYYYLKTGGESSNPYLNVVHFLNTSGLDYKSFTIIIDDARVTRKWRSKMQCHLWS